MNDKNYSVVYLLPVLLGFFVMGFVDVVGISTSYVQHDFGLSNTMSNLLPMMVFLWFALLSIPTGILMNKIGRKNTVMVSMLVTLIAMCIPLFVYTFASSLVTFALLGIGNTILQVSLNPLVSNVVRPSQLTSRLTLGQFIKAISSFLGPIIAGFSAAVLGNWKLLFPIFGGIIILSAIWLWFTPITEENRAKAGTSYKKTLGLLKDSFIFKLFLGIVCVVGVDVGMNIGIPKILIERTSWPLEQAGLGTSLYFAARTAGTLLGAILLVKFSAFKLFKISVWIAVLSLIALIFSSGAMLVLILVSLIGFAIANIFPIIFSTALQHKPNMSNEVSGLMIMGVAGGAILPILMGLASDVTGGRQTGGMIVILLAVCYLFYAAYYFSNTRMKEVNQ